MYRSLVVLIVASLPLSAAAQSSKWYGTLDAKSRHFRFELTINRLASQTTGTLKSLDEGGRTFELSNLAWTGKERQFEIAVSKGLFEGELSEDGKQVVGVWKQRTAELPLTFRQLDKPPVERYAAIWKGEIKVPFQSLTVAIRVKKDGELYFDSLKQKAGGFLGKIEEKDGAVTFEVPALRGKFEGKYSEDGEKLEGTWRQGLARFTLNMTKAELDDLKLPEPKRPQTPKPPFPYEVTEVTVPVMADGKESHRLAGTLTVPKEAKPIAVVIMASGSGPQDRDESLLGHKPFWVIADHFGRHRIAVLRLDDRGVGKSTGDHDTATTADFADDIEAAVKYVKSQTELKQLPLGIAGHSEGGLIAPLVAARNKSVGFIVLLAGPSVDGATVAYNQVKRLATSAGDPPPAVEAKLQMNKALVDAMRSNPDGDAKVIADAALEDLAEQLTEEQLQPAEELIRAGAVRVATPWFRFFATYDPAPTLRNVTCPVLAIFGEKDIQVAPDVHAPVMQEAVKAAGNPQSVVKTLDGLNHLFQPAKTGGVDEYESIETTVAPQVLQLMVDWIEKVAK